MPESDRTLREAFEAIGRVEAACETRAKGHIDREVYDLEMAQIRKDITAVRDALTDEAKRRERADQGEKDARERADEKLAERLTWANRAAVTGLLLPIVVGLIWLLVEVSR